MADPSALAKLCRAIYDPCDEFDAIVDNGSVCLGRTGSTIACRGSATLRDWLHDVEAIPQGVPLVGTVHDGMWEGVPDAYENLKLRSGDSIVLTGHSLGCAHAAYLARLCLLRGVTVEGLYLFAPPRCGFQDFHDGLRNVHHVRAWRNRYDPVPSLPFSTDVAPWAQFPLIELDMPPGGIEDVDIVAWHSIDLYVKALTS